MDSAESNRYIDNSVKTIIVGNKTDKDSERQISYEEGEKFAASQKMAFMEISAKDDKNVNETFETLANHIQNNIILSPKRNSRTASLRLTINQLPNKNKKNVIAKYLS